MGRRFLDPWRAREADKRRKNRLEYGLTGEAAIAVRKLIEARYPNVKVQRMERIYAGSEQRAAGAWSWCAICDEVTIGSAYSMQDILSAGRVEELSRSAGTIELIPEDLHAKKA